MFHTGAVSKHPHVPRPDLFIPPQIAITSHAVFAGVTKLLGQLGRLGTISTFRLFRTPLSRDEPVTKRHFERSRQLELPDSAHQDISSATLKLGKTRGAYGTLRGVRHVDFLAMETPIESVD